MKDTKNRDQKYVPIDEECGNQFFIINDLKENGPWDIRYNWFDGDYDVAITNANFKKNRFLFECDEAGSIQMQCEYAKKVENIAWSCVYSGGKSIHIIINTNYDGDSEEMHQMLWYKLKDRYFHGIKMDEQCKNSARKSRKPNEIRDNGVLQKLCYFYPDHILDISELIKETKSEMIRERVKQEFIQEQNSRKKKLNGYDTKQSYAEKNGNDLKAVLSINEEKSKNRDALRAAKHVIQGIGGWNESAKAVGYLKELGYPDYIIKNEIDWGDWDIRKYLK